MKPSEKFILLNELDRQRMGQQFERYSGYEEVKTDGYGSFITEQCSCYSYSG